MQQTGRPKYLVVQVRAAQLKPLEGPEAYADVGRRVCGKRRVIRPWVRRGEMRKSAVERDRAAHTAPEAVAPYAF